MDISKTRKGLLLLRVAMIAEIAVILLSIFYLTMSWPFITGNHEALAGTDMMQRANTVAILSYVLMAFSILVFIGCCVLTALSIKCFSSASRLGAVFFIIHFALLVIASILTCATPWVANYVYCFDGQWHWLGVIGAYLSYIFVWLGAWRLSREVPWMRWAKIGAQAVVIAIPLFFITLILAKGHENFAIGILVILFMFSTIAGFLATYVFTLIYSQKLLAKRAAQIEAGEEISDNYKALKRNCIIVGGVYILLLILALLISDRREEAMREYNERIERERQEMNERAKSADERIEREQQEMHQLAESYDNVKTDEEPTTTQRAKSKDYETRHVATTSGPKNCRISGSVGKYPVEMRLTIDGSGIVNGRYRYTKTGSHDWIDLNGYEVGNGESIEVYEEYNGNITGTWSLSGHYQGGDVTLTGTMVTPKRQFNVNLKGTY